MPEPVRIILQCPGCGTLILLGNTWQGTDCCDYSRVEYRVIGDGGVLFIETRDAPPLSIQAGLPDV